jgi:hypothetical protein
VNEILIRRTYDGVLLGRPNERTNQMLLTRFEQWVGGQRSVEMPFIIEPELKIDTREGQHLPAYACAVRITHTEPAHDKSRDMSSTVIVWYQQANPLFGGMEIVEKLKDLIWADVATDGDY